MAREDYKGIWVFAEQEHGTLHPTVFELLAKAAELKAVCGEKITAVLLGSRYAGPRSPCRARPGSCARKRSMFVPTRTTLWKRP